MKPKSHVRVKALRVRFIESNRKFTIGIVNSTRKFSPAGGDSKCSGGSHVLGHVLRQIAPHPTENPCFSNSESKKKFHEKNL
jgi:hypothetical protein